MGCERMNQIHLAQDTQRQCACQHVYGHTDDSLKVSVSG